MLFKITTLIYFSYVYEKCSIEHIIAVTSPSSIPAGCPSARAAKHRSLQVLLMPAFVQRNVWPQRKGQALCYQVYPSRFFFFPAVTSIVAGKSTNANYQSFEALKISTRSCGLLQVGDDLPLMHMLHTASKQL